MNLKFLSVLTLCFSGGCKLKTASHLASTANQVDTQSLAFPTSQSDVELGKAAFDQRFPAGVSNNPQSTSVVQRGTFGANIPYYGIQLFFENRDHQEEFLQGLHTDLVNFSWNKPDRGQIHFYANNQGYRISTRYQGDEDVQIGYARVVERSDVEKARQAMQHWFPTAEGGFQRQYHPLAIELESLEGYPDYYQLRLVFEDDTHRQRFLSGPARDTDYRTVFNRLREDQTVDNLQFNYRPDRFVTIRSVLQE